MSSGFQVLSTTRGEKKFRLQFTAGTSGAVPSTFTRARGIASVVKSTNDYIITMSKGYTAVLDCDAKVLQASSSTTGAWEAKMTAEDVATNKTITISPYTAAGSAVALASGDVLRVTFSLKTSPGLA